jgi:hypothetical protein
MKSLAKRQSDRHATCAALALALENWLNSAAAKPTPRNVAPPGAGAHGPRPAPVRRQEKAAGRPAVEVSPSSSSRRRFIWLVVSGLLALAILATGLFLSTRNAGVKTGKSFQETINDANH